MKILFTVIPEKGHLHPMIGPALHLQARGHDVIFHAASDISAELQRAGLHGYLPMHMMPPERHDANRGRIFADHVRDPLWLQQWIRHMLIDQTEAAIPQMIDVMRAANADLVITDPMHYAAIVAAHLQNLRWITLSNSLNPVLPNHLNSALLTTIEGLQEARSQLFQRHGMKNMTIQFRGCDALSPLLSIAFTTEELIGHHVSGVAMVGPSLPPGRRGDEPDFDWNWLAPRLPLLYMSLGSQIYYQPRMFETVLAAVAELPLQLVLSAGELAGQGPLSQLPYNVTAVRYAPQLALLARANAMITHGGANSVMEALSFGVPLLCTPICNDQFHQAYFIRRSGSGIELDLQHASITETRAAIQALLEQPSYRTQAARIGASYQRNGALEAALLVEQACN